MNTTGLRPALLFHGDIFWFAWDRHGQGIFALDATEPYLKVQGLLENEGYYDVPENSAIATAIRERVEKRTHDYE